MKTKLRGLTLTAMLMSASHLSLADDAAPTVVGDLPGYGEEAYFSEEAAYAVPDPVQAANHVGDLPAMPASFAGDLIPGEAVANPFVGMTPYQPIGLTQLRQVDHYAGGYEIAGCDTCGGSCDGGCDSKCGSSSRFGRLGKMMKCSDDTWATAEFLLWFVQDRDMAPLVTTSAAGTFPVLPASDAAPNPDGVTTVFGDDIDGELSAGFRGDIGKFVTSRLGIGGRFWGLNHNTDSYYGATDGSDISIGRPFFNTNTDGEDAVLVGIDNGVVGFTGEIAAQSTLKLWAAEGYARMRLGCAKSCRLDFLGGYSHINMQDDLWISSSAFQTNPATGQLTTLVDSFRTKNRFNGGQLGFEMVMNHGRWSVRSLTKVHLGNMNQEVQIAGLSLVQPAGGAATVNSGGVLAGGNQGTYERDKFAFVPEANFKVGYCVRKNVLVSAGYTFLYMDNVALVGDVIDRDVDGTTITTGTFGSRPAFNFDDSSLFVQGLDLGVVWNY